MIYLRLCGGLGNQLFQLAQALSRCEMRPEKIRIYSGDLGSYEVPRSYELDKLFNLSFSTSGPYSSAFLASRIVKIVSMNNIFINDKNYFPIYRSRWPVCFLDGYFQFEQNWDDIRDSIEFMRKNLLRGIVVPNKSGLVVHARGGDFLLDGKSHQHQISFYQNCLPFLAERGLNSGILYCSDAEYGLTIKTFFKEEGIDLEFVSNSDASWEDDFKKMANAALLIGSRSTFCWWASVLGRVTSLFPSDFHIGTKRKLFHPNEVII